MGAHDDNGVRRKICALACWYPRPVEGDIRQVEFQESDQPEADFVAVVRVATGDRTFGQFMRDHHNCGDNPEVEAKLVDGEWVTTCRVCDTKQRLAWDSFTGVERKLGD